MDFSLLLRTPNGLRTVKLWCQTCSKNYLWHASMVFDIWLVQTTSSTPVATLLYTFLKEYLWRTVNWLYPRSYRSQYEVHPSLYIKIPGSTCLWMKGIMVGGVRSAKGYTVMTLNSRSTIQTPRPAKPKSKGIVWNFYCYKKIDLHFS